MIDQNTTNTEQALSRFDQLMLEQAQKKASAPKDKTGKSVPMASNAQIVKYENDCKYKSVEPVDGYKLMTKTAISAEITRIKSIVKSYPMSIGQRNRLTWLFEHCKLSTPENFDNWDSTHASDAIEQGNAYYDKNFAHLPTTNQLELIHSMFTCPDVNKAELMMIPIKIGEELLALQTTLASLYEVEVIAISEAQNNIKGANKTYQEVRTNIALTLEEIKSMNQGIETLELEYDESNLTKDTCSEFISKYQQTYRHWLSDRASEGQRGLINSMLKRSGNPELPYEAIIQFSRNYASNYINQLQAEGGAPRTYTPQEEEYNDLKLRLPNTMTKAGDAHHETLTNIVYALCASIGQNGDNNPLLESNKFDEDLIDLVKLCYSFSMSFDNLVEILAPILTEEKLAEILEVDLKKFNK